MAYQGRGALGDHALEDPALLEQVVGQVKERLSDHVHVLHEYTDETLAGGLTPQTQQCRGLIGPNLQTVNID